MKLRKIKWGCNEVGIGCGPISYPMTVEIMVTHNKHHYFICATNFNEFMNIIVTPVSVYDILTEGYPYEVDLEYENDTANKLASEMYSFEFKYSEDEAIAEMNKSEFTAAFKFVCIAMNAAWELDEPTMEDAEEFLAEFPSNDLSEFCLPDFQEIFDDKICTFTEYEEMEESNSEEK